MVFYVLEYIIHLEIITKLFTFLKKKYRKNGILDNVFHVGHLRIRGYRDEDLVEWVILKSKGSKINLEMIPQLIF